MRAEPTLQAAVSYLGFKTVRNLALTASVSDIFKRDEIEARVHAAINALNREGQ